MSKKDNNFSFKDSVSLKEFLCSKINALEDKIELNLKLNQIVLDKTEAKLEERLARMNELREAMNDQSKTFVTRREHEITFEGANKDIKELMKTKDIASGKASQTSLLFAYLLAGIGIALSVIQILTN